MLISALSKASRPVADRFVDSAPVEFVRAEPADAAVLAEMDRICFPHPWSQAAFAKCLNNPNVAVEIAMQKGAALGTCQLNYGRMGPDSASIDNLEVVPAARGHHLGEELLLHALQQAKRYGSQQAFLEVDATNTTAQRLYEKFGFKNEKLLPDYYHEDGHDGYLMHLPDLQHASLK